MAQVDLFQFSFNGGELDPSLHSRSDHAKYASGATKIKNMVVRPHGGAFKRPGTRLVDLAMDQDHPSRLIPFRFSVKQSYILEFYNFGMRVIKDGWPVTYPDDHEKAGEYVTIATPFKAEDLPNIRFAQTADKMYLVHPSYAPRLLSRTDHHIWQMTSIGTGIGINPPQAAWVSISGGITASYCVTAVSPSNDESIRSDIITITANKAKPSNPYALSYNDCRKWLLDSGYTPNDIIDSKSEYELYLALTARGYVADPDPNHCYFAQGIDNNWTFWFKRPNEAFFRILVIQSFYWANPSSQLHQEARYAAQNGQWPEATSALQDQINNIPYRTNGSSVISWTAVPGAKSYNIYRQEQGKYCFVNSTSNLTFEDSIYSSYNPQRSPLTKQTIFGLSGTGNDNPAIASFFEQRLIFARTNDKPNTFWGSRVGNHLSFGSPESGQISADDSYEFTIDSSQVNEIAWMVPMNSLLIGTTGGEIKAGGNGQPLTIINPDVRVQSWYGCALIDPVIAGRSVVFVGRSRRILRDLAYSLEADGFAGNDLTIFAQHLFQNSNIVNLCYQQEPDSTLWVVLSDGTLLSCTYLPEQQILGWCRHETMGQFEACASLVNENGSDDLYFVVCRKIKGETRRFIEVIDKHIIPSHNPHNCFYVDCGLTYSSDSGNNPTAVLNGLEHLEGSTVCALADGNAVMDLQVVNGAISLPVKASNIHVGLPYTAELETLDMEPLAMGTTIRNRPRQISSAVIRFFQSRECLAGPAHDRLDTIFRRSSGEAPGMPMQLRTGDEKIHPSPPPDGTNTRLLLQSPSPVPMGILSILAKGEAGAS